MSSIKVGPYTYEVRICNAQEIDGFDHERWGDHRADKQQIRIHEHAQGTVALVTLMHESLHAIEFLMGQDITEPVIRSLAPLLVGLLEENGVDLTPLEDLLREAAK